jgi:hypothetical protein
MELVSGGIRIARVKPMSQRWIAIIEDRFSIGFDVSYSADSRGKCLRWVQKWAAARREHLAELIAEPVSPDARGGSIGATGLQASLCASFGGWTGELSAEVDKP